jgi:hypothetical protein
MSLYFILGICLMAAPFAYIYYLTRDAQGADRSRYNPNGEGGSMVSSDPGGYAPI